MYNINSIIITEKEVKEKGYFIENSILNCVNLVLEGHFNNLVSIEMLFSNANIRQGFVLDYIIPEYLRVISEVLELRNEDGLRISSIKNEPVRIITTENKYGKVIGFGNFAKDKFVLMDDIFEFAREQLLETVNILQKEKFI